MEHTVDKQTMESLAALANMNLKISEARNTLSKLESLEEAYLTKREQKALARVAKALEESKGLQAETRKNHEEIKNLSDTITSSAGFLATVYKDFEVLMAKLDARNKAWEAGVKKQEAEIDFMKRDINTERVRIANTKESLERQKVLLSEEKIRINDQRGVLERMVERISKNSL